MLASRRLWLALTALTALTALQGLPAVQAAHGDLVDEFTCQNCIGSAEYCPSNGDAFSCPTDSLTVNPATALHDCTCNAGFLKTCVGTGTTGTTACNSGDFACPQGPTPDFYQAGDAIPCATERETTTAGATQVANCLCTLGHEPQGGTSSEQCFACNNGFYKDATDNNPCAGCPAFSGHGGTASITIADCMCNAGYSGLINVVGDTDTCEQCEAGKYKAEQGEGIDGDGACGPCTENHYCLVGTSVPEDCREQSVVAVGAGVDAESCECNPGYTLDDTHSQPDIHTEPCVQCALGKARSGTGNLPCVDCPASPDVTFADERGLENCKICNSNMQQNSTLTGCECLAGYIDAGNYAESNPTCTQCGQSTYQEAARGSVCTDCPVNSEHDNLAESARSACECSIGYYTGPDNDDTDYCQSCLSGKYKDTVANTETCTDCPENSETDETLLSAFIDGSLNQQSTCVCKAGFYNDGTDDALNCLVCVPGTFKNVQGNEACTNCAEGTYLYAGHADGQVACENCPLNSNSPLGSDAQEDCTCNPGFSGADGGPCVACTAGQKNVADGCVTCGNLEYQPDEGATECLACGPNSDSTPADRSQCLCDAGNTCAVNPLVQAECLVMQTQRGQSESMQDLNTVNRAFTCGAGFDENCDIQSSHASTFCHHSICALTNTCQSAPSNECESLSNYGSYACQGGNGCTSGGTTSSFRTYISRKYDDNEYLWFYWDLGRPTYISRVSLVPRYTNNWKTWGGAVFLFHDTSTTSPPTTTDAVYNFALQDAQKDYTFEATQIQYVWMQFEAMYKEDEITEINDAIEYWSISFYTTCSVSECPNGYCAACPVNTYKDVTGDAACTDCQTNAQTPIINSDGTDHDQESDCKCNRGYIQADTDVGTPDFNPICTACLPGQYSDDYEFDTLDDSISTNDLDATTCTDCGVYYHTETHHPAGDSTQCEACTDTCGNGTDNRYWLSGCLIDGYVVDTNNGDYVCGDCPAGLAGTDSASLGNEYNRGPEATACVCLPGAYFNTIEYIEGVIDYSKNLALSCGAEENEECIVSYVSGDWDTSKDASNILTPNGDVRTNENTNSVQTLSIDLGKTYNVAVLQLTIMDYAVNAGLCSHNSQCFDACGTYFQFSTSNAQTGDDVLNQDDEVVRLKGDLCKLTNGGERGDPTVKIYSANNPDDIIAELDVEAGTGNAVFKFYVPNIETRYVILKLQSDTQFGGKPFNTGTGGQHHRQVKQLEVFAYQSREPACDYCPDGHFKSTYGPEACTACTGNTNTQPCSDGVENCNEATDCLCDAGYYDSDPDPVISNCVICDPGTFKLSINDVASCTTCHIVDINSGSWGPLPAEGQVQEEVTGLSACTCDAGYEPKPGGCTACPAGKFKAFGGDDECEECAAGEYAPAPAVDTAGALACLQCDSNAVSDAGAAQCLCNAGYQQVAAVDGAHDATGHVCQECVLDDVNHVAGTWKGSAGTQACQACKTSCGYKSQSPLVPMYVSALCTRTIDVQCSECDSCGSGHYASNECVHGSIDLDNNTICTACENGYYCSVDGSYLTSDRTDCGGTSSFDPRTSAEDCGCEAGKRFDDEGEGASNTCVLCVGNTWCLLDTEYQCPGNSTIHYGGAANEESFHDDIFDCQCNAGYYRDPYERAVDSVPDVADSFICQDCNINSGDTSDGHGITDFQATYCINNEQKACADPNEETGNNADDQDDCKCKAGYSLNAGECQPCPVGTYCPALSDARFDCQTIVSGESESHRYTLQDQQDDEFDCICKHGYYSQNWNSGLRSTEDIDVCVPCTEDHFCPGIDNNQHECTVNSESPGGTSSIHADACKCSAGFGCTPLALDNFDTLLLSIDSNTSNCVTQEEFSVYTGTDVVADTDANNCVDQTELEAFHTGRAASSGCPGDRSNFPITENKGTCTACVIAGPTSHVGGFFKFGSSNTACSVCTPCPYSLHYTATQCVETADRVCGDCSTCESDTYLSTPCSDSNAIVKPICSACNDCTSYTRPFITQDCKEGGDVTKNRLCDEIDVSVCTTTGQYRYLSDAKTGIFYNFTSTCEPCDLPSSTDYPTDGNKLHTFTSAGRELNNEESCKFDCLPGTVLRASSKTDRTSILQGCETCETGNFLLKDIQAGATEQVLDIDGSSISMPVSCKFTCDTGLRVEGTECVPLHNDRTFTGYIALTSGAVSRYQANPHTLHAWQFNLQHTTTGRFVVVAGKTVPNCGPDNLQCCVAGSLLVVDYADFAGNRAGVILSPTVSCAARAQNDNVNDKVTTIQDTGTNFVLSDAQLPNYATCAGQNGVMVCSMYFTFIDILLHRQASISVHLEQHNTGHMVLTNNKDQHYILLDFFNVHTRLLYTDTGTSPPTSVYEVELHLKSEFPSDVVATIAVHSSSDVVSYSDAATFVDVATAQPACTRHSLSSDTSGIYSESETIATGVQQHWRTRWSMPSTRTSMRVRVDFRRTASPSLWISSIDMLRKVDGYHAICDSVNRAELFTLGTARISVGLSDVMQDIMPGVTLTTSPKKGLVNKLCTVMLDRLENVPLTISRITIFAVHVQGLDTTQQSQYDTLKLTATVHRSDSVYKGQTPKRSVYGFSQEMRTFCANVGESKCYLENIHAQDPQVAVMQTCTVVEQNAATQWLHNNIGRVAEDHSANICTVRGEKNALILMLKLRAGAGPAWDSSNADNMDKEITTNLWIGSATTSQPV